MWNTRAIAYCIRFKTNVLAKLNSTAYQNGSLSITEICKAQKVIIRLVQQRCFPEEYQIFLENKSLPPKNKLLKLNPFLDLDQVMRVGGRLELSQFWYDKKHHAISQRSCYKINIEKWTFLD